VCGAGRGPVLGRIPPCRLRSTSRRKKEGAATLVGRKAPKPREFGQGCGVAQSGWAGKGPRRRQKNQAGRGGQRGSLLGAKRVFLFAGGARFPTGGGRVRHFPRRYGKKTQKKKGRTLGKGGEGRGAFPGPSGRSGRRRPIQIRAGWPIVRILGCRKAHEKDSAPDSEFGQQRRGGIRR